MDKDKKSPRKPHLTPRRLRVQENDELDSGELNVRDYVGVGRFIRQPSYHKEARLPRPRTD